jgi:hypothetical protein
LLKAEILGDMDLEVLLYDDVFGKGTVFKLKGISSMNNAADMVTLGESSYAFADFFDDTGVVATGYGSRG